MEIYIIALLLQKPIITHNQGELIHHSISSFKGVHLNDSESNWIWIHVSLSNTWRNICSNL